MKSKFKLIDGIFTVREAREIIVSLVETKIQYHNRENFSNEIRYGSAHDNSVKRKEQLIAMKKEFLAVLEGMEDDSMLEINADINIV